MVNILARYLHCHCEAQGLLIPVFLNNFSKTFKRLHAQERLKLKSLRNLHCENPDLFSTGW